MKLECSFVYTLSRGIAYITYAPNGTPQKIHFTSGNVTRYRYSASGQKLGVEYRVAVPNTTVTFGVEPDALTYSQTMYAGSTDYLLGGSLTMRNGRIDKLQFEEGYCQAEKYAGDNSKDDFFFYYYDQDHLGSVRQVVKADRTTNGTVVQTMDYYPFGAHYFCKMKRELGHPRLQSPPHRIKLKKSKNCGHTQGMSLQTYKLINS